MSLSAEEIARYQRDGFIVVEDVLSPAEISDLRRVTDALVESARTVTAHTGVYDLEPSHTPAAPRVRRIKKPHLVDPVFDRTMRHPRIVAILRDLLGPAVRWDESKLNLKSPGYGAAVEWHQDWAFYPHTNDDLCAVGVMMDDCAMENGPLLIIPGSHKGGTLQAGHDLKTTSYPLWTLDQDTVTRLCREAERDGEPGIVAPTGKPGSVLMFHGNLVHASAPNITPYPRKIIYLTLCAVSNHITKFNRPEFIAHRDFTPIAPVNDDALVEYARAHRIAAE